TRETELNNQRIKQLEWERQTPERERSERAAKALRLQQETERQREYEQAQREQSSRDHARLKCRLYYDAHANQLNLVFNRDLLQEYFDTYMTDSHSLTEVELRAQMLVEMLQAHVKERPLGTKSFNSMSEIADYFSQKRTELESLPYDAETRESLRTAISQRENAAISALFKGSR
ncbi:MAG: hypothetical protein KDA68_20840, partial [Planctomycetaceae bacterium]|nr:hypothetical protein [Planctomycetaceae bacterium]